MATLRQSVKKWLGASPQHLGQLTPEDEIQAHKIAGSKILVPNNQLLRSIGTDNIEDFLRNGEAWANLIAEAAPEDSNILDIGCGCSRVARFLAENPSIKRYAGFDTMREVISWNRNYILPYCLGEFEFTHLDIYSRAYNPAGKLKAADVVFPVDECSIDLVFASSLFTHLKEEDAKRYLAETYRCLKLEGKALISVHVSTEITEKYTGSEFRIDVQEAHFINMAENAGLHLAKNFGNVYGQEIFLFKKK